MDYDFLLTFIETEAEVELEHARNSIELADMYQDKGDLEKAEDYTIMARVATVKARALRDEYARVVKELKGEMGD